MPSAGPSPQPLSPEPGATPAVEHPAFTPAERDALYADFCPLIRKLIRRYGDSPELREDLEGEIFYRFCGLLDAYDPGRGVPLRPYLVRKLIAAVYTYARSHWRRQRQELLLELDSSDFDVIGMEDPTPAGQRHLIREEIHEALARIMHRLPPRQRRVILYRYYEDCSYEEIAERMSITVATARSLARHGVNGLRRHLASMGVTSR